MSTVVVVGAQWGDEAKGKIVDLLSDGAKVSVRYNGGPNAGHRVVIGGEVFAQHLVPSGIFRPDTACVIGDNVVIDPASLLEEIDGLKARGITCDNLKISPNAHLVMSYHRLQDGLEEDALGSGKIGTTRRGVGPCYQDKAARRGIRVCDLVDPARFREKLAAAVAQKNLMLTRMYGAEPLDLEALIEEYGVYGQRLRPFVADTCKIIADAVLAGEKVVFEGAQGSLLDRDYGTYPFVTSSHPIAAGACLGTGIGPRHIDRIIGVVKAYTTRVGTGPMPTELHDGDGDKIRRRGNEYGTTTGRPRRCGWLDVVLLRHSARINSLDALSVMLLDVLSTFPTLKICTGYRTKEGITKDFPADRSLLDEMEPVYEEMPGWSQEITDVRSYSDLPLNAQRYLKRIEGLVGVPVEIVSVGPDREQTIFTGDHHPERSIRVAA
jgi:adenylosuccinate synthase